jgi:hypothetical protein
MAKGSMQIVREALQSYADRGVFRGFHESGKGRFSFTWFYHHPLQLTVDVAKHSLKFEHLLPGVSAQAPLYAELKRFVQERHDVALPEHRRIERQRALATCANRRGQVSLTLKVKHNDYAYGINKLVNLVHELFVHLRATHPEYLVENFDVPQE